MKWYAPLDLLSGFWDAPTTSSSKKDITPQDAPRTSLRENLPQSLNRVTLPQHNQPNIVSHSMRSNCRNLAELDTSLISSPVHNETFADKIVKPHNDQVNADEKNRSLPPSPCDEIAGERNGRLPECHGCFIRDLFTRLWLLSICMVNKK